MSDAAQPSEQDDDESAVLIIVVRSGGISGMSRRWKVEPARDQASHWIALIERCPWTDPGPSQQGADRYVWSIRARTPEAKHEREVPEAALDGPWRELVDAVRAATTTTLNDRIVPPA
ncbi:protealysin inhibitor emfourin [Microbacterium sp. TWP3-1-2b2]|uniref:protealysin inhibitor emfourin n=1 Tax=Microbacterium sp. TWP3-1-2b2 TaxID=2804651 RepID=UPI003CEB4E3E